jgi:hypothetical protein
MAQYRVQWQYGVEPSGFTSKEFAIFPKIILHNIFTAV